MSVLMYERKRFAKCTKETSNRYRPWENERLHADDGFQLLPYETRERGRADLRREYVRDLKASGSLKLWKLAARLETCRRRRRCGSGACPQCSKATNRWIQRILQEQFRGQANDLVMVSITPSEPSQLARRLCWIDVDEAAKHIQGRLVAAGLGEVPFIAGLDLEHNLLAYRDERQRAEQYWTLTWQGFMAHRDPQSLQSAMQAEVPASWKVQRPVVVTPVTTLPERAYPLALKDHFTFGQADAVLATLHVQTRLEMRAGHKGLYSLLWFLDRIGFYKRLYTQNVTVFVWDC